MLIMTRHFSRAANLKNRPGPGRAGPASGNPIAPGRKVLAAGDGDGPWLPSPASKSPAAGAAERSRGDWATSHQSVTSQSVTSQSMGSLKGYPRADREPFGIL